MYVEPVNIGWHFGKRVDFNAGYVFTSLQRAGTQRERAIMSARDIGETI